MSERVCSECNGKREIRKVVEVLCTKGCCRSYSDYPPNRKVGCKALLERKWKLIPCPSCQNRPPNS